ncbi:SDR family NAD(P)-dependent oxidoreductase [Falsiroseomonas sp.]|uniref:SDR family NAD(P)-dependent oxidoreductase n=1 Tax=Falsiroseomonas sp. TaxID=2870721 RepID=UPI003565876E
MPRRALVTAAASGIGLAIVRALRAAGWQVVLSDLAASEGAARAAELDAEWVACDLRDATQIEALAVAAGDVFLLVNNGGIAGPTLPVAAMPPEAWEEVLAVNLTAPFLLSRAVVPRMQAAGGGVIVNMASVAARIGHAERSPYVASKWGLLGLTATLAREVGAQGIRVNAILPGSVRGARIEAVLAAYAAANDLTPEAAEARYLARQATGRFVEPEEIAALVLFLASDAARSITGQFLGVDGGFQ